MVSFIKFKEFEEFCYRKLFREALKGKKFPKMYDSREEVIISTILKDSFIEELRKNIASASSIDTTKYILNLYIYSISSIYNELKKIGNYQNDFVTFDRLSEKTRNEYELVGVGNFTLLFKSVVNEIDFAANSFGYSVTQKGLAPQGTKDPILYYPSFPETEEDYDSLSDFTFYTQKDKVKEEMEMEIKVQKQVIVCYLYEIGLFKYLSGTPLKLNPNQIGKIINLIATNQVTSNSVTTTITRISDRHNPLLDKYATDLNKLHLTFKTDKIV